VRSQRLFGRMDGVGVVHREDFKSLKATVAARDEADHARAFKRSLEAVLAQAGHMEEHIADPGLVRQDEP
jgi:BMFP domain-containing protein YqiC